MGKGRFVTVAAVAVMSAAGWLAMAGAPNKEAPEARRVEVYSLKNVDAQVVAESLNRLLGGREDLRIAADGKHNRLVVFAAEKDQATLRAFLTLVSRSGKRGCIDAEPPPKLMFPEEVERAMIGEGCRLRRIWPQEREPDIIWDGSRPPKR